MNGKNLIYMANNSLALSQTSQTKWSYEDMRIKSSDGFCVGVTTSDLKVSLAK